jgi:hypothetical protein
LNRAEVALPAAACVNSLDYQHSLAAQISHLRMLKFARSSTRTWCGMWPWRHAVNTATGRPAVERIRLSK